MKNAIDDTLRYQFDETNYLFAKSFLKKVKTRFKPAIQPKKSQV